MSQTLGPCIKGLCTDDAVAYVSRTAGSSPRLTVITGTRAAVLADDPGSVLELMCADHAHETLDALLGEARP